MASHRVCAKTLELVVGRSIRIASVAMVLFEVGGLDTFADNRSFGKVIAENEERFPRRRRQFVASCCTASNPDLPILIVSAYCSGLRCSRFNLN